MKASLKQYRQSPRKVRLVTDLVKGKHVNAALSELKFTPKRASAAVAKLIASATANAETNNGKSKDHLFIKEITVNEGKTLYRILPMSKGRAFRMRKRTSHIDLELGEYTNTKKEVKKETKKVKKTDKK